MAVNDYGISIWGDDNFKIKNGRVVVNALSEPALIDIVHTLQDDGYKGPMILRFNHLIKKQIDNIYQNFARAIKEFDYQGKFAAVYPLKVNQYPGFVKNLVKFGRAYGYGLEAGSKAELLLAMAYNNPGAPITVNGFKDKELLTMGFIAAEMGHNITLTVEGVNELENIVAIAAERPSGLRPNIGLRVRLHSLGSGIWASSGGINSKFGLNSTELIEAVGLLKEHGLIERFSMIHFHIGSQINEIGPLKRALSEAANIYVELRKMGASSLLNIDLGGGLAVEYSQFISRPERNYTLSEYANDIVFILKSIASAKGAIEPNIYIESGRFVSASHAVLIAPVLELFSQEYSESKLALKEKNPQLIDELCDLYKNITPANAIEYMHDSADHLNSVLTLFDLGYVDLQDRSNAEILAHLVSKKALSMLDPARLVHLQKGPQERYLVNFSMFQSLPDFWGLGQEFPIMPLDRLEEAPTRSATIWDITCDSDGEIAYDAAKRPFFLHDVDVEKEEYFLGFFLVGAYQETLGMKHNLFTHPTQVCIDVTKRGVEIENIIESQSIRDILEDLDYDVREIDEILKEKIMDSQLDERSKKHVLGELFIFIHDNGYLKNI